MKINQFVPDSKIFDSFNIKDNKTEKSDSSSSNFLDILKEKLDTVNEKQIAAEDTTNSFIKGEETDIHKVMLDTEEAKMSLELAVQVRNKLVEAYQELSRMQL